MNETDKMTKDALKLPPSIVTKIDVSRLLSELEAIDGELISREAKAKSGIQPGGEIMYSEHLTDFLAVNKTEVSQDSVQRSYLLNKLRHFKKTVPTIHITFATSADNESLQKIAAWLRQSVHPQAVIKVGLQPSLIGGVYVRTTNHVHDFSLRAKLASHRDIITKELEMLSGTN